MIASPSPRAARAGVHAAALLYWLAVICGLAAVTVVRWHTPADLGPLAPIWVGTIFGAAIGQGLAFARMPAWVIGAVGFGALFFLAPFAAMLAYSMFGDALEPAMLALAPAAVCGYLSLTPRGGLASFWYPCVLWMLVILDGPSGNAIDRAHALPFVIGLAAIFVVYLRAREARRAALWQTHGNERIAKAVGRTVLRESPVRATFQTTWTLAVGLAALMLMAWIAPHLWQREETDRKSQAHAAAMAASPSQSTCCESMSLHQDRVKEYIPLRGGRSQSYTPNLDSCLPCESAPSQEELSYVGSGVGKHGQTYPYPYGAGTAETTGVNAGGVDFSPATQMPYTPVTAVPVNPTLAPIPAPNGPVVTMTPHPAPHPNVDIATHVGSTPAPVKKLAPVVGPGSAPQVSPVAVVPVRPLEEPRPPWRGLLGLAAITIAIQLVLRALRRALTLRHLERPFWNETLDQRISNHWQRALIGLRDAGIQPTATEQPCAFAKRTGIAALQTCAEILERVRHGVSVDGSDLTDMNVAATAAYRAARYRAGAASRAVAWLRSELA